MKKILSFAALSLSLMMTVSCGNSKKTDDGSQLSDSDSCSEVVTPADVVNPHQIGKEQTVIGVTLDRAMNSILILDENGDSLSFSYADVDDRSKIAGSNIGDTVTVKYVKLASSRDSVTAIFRGKRP